MCLGGSQQSAATWQTRATQRGLGVHYADKLLKPPQIVIEAAKRADEYRGVEGSKARLDDEQANRHRYRHQQRKGGEE